MTSETDRQPLIASTDVWVVKVGSRVLTGPDGRLDRLHLDVWPPSYALSPTQASKWSWSVASGCVRYGQIGFTHAPHRSGRIASRRGSRPGAFDPNLRTLFHSAWSPRGQILLTADDLDNRTRYLNVRNTLLTLLRFGVVPIINENDTVAVDELMTTFGDNDRLAAMVAGLLPRPLLVILSDVAGLYDRDPADPGANVLRTVTQVDDATFELVRDKRTGLSKGGMGSKLRAAQFVTGSGSPVIIACGRDENVLPRLMAGEQLGSLFLPQSRSLAPRKRWIGFSAQSCGEIHVDDGAVKAIINEGRSLLAIGIRDVSGKFEKGDIVSIVASDGREIARGLINYSAVEVRQIRGCRSPRIAEILGQCPYEEVVHRDNMAITGSA